jgi:hypothetical protein
MSAVKQSCLILVNLSKESSYAILQSIVKYVSYQTFDWRLTDSDGSNLLNQTLSENRGCGRKLPSGKEESTLID